MKVQLTQEGTGTRLRLVRRGLEGDAAMLHDHGWGRFLHRLDAAVADTDPSVDPTTETPSDILDRIREEA